MTKTPISRLSVISLTVLLLSVASAAGVAAEDGVPDVIADVTIMSATMDTKTRVPTVGVTVRCVANGEFVRIRASLVQVRSNGKVAESQQVASASCTAGTVLTFDLAFGPQVGTFVPGRARVSGFVEAYELCCIIADVELVPQTSVKLRPQS